MPTLSSSLKLQYPKKPAENQIESETIAKDFFATLRNRGLLSQKINFKTIDVLRPKIEPAERKSDNVQKQISPTKIAPIDSGIDWDEDI